MQTHAQGRIDWVDRAKGIAIVAVVAGHVWHKLDKLGVFIPGNLYHTLDVFLYSFHVPVFFFLSGVFYGPQLDKNPSIHIIGERARLLLYPYFVWSIIQTGIEVFVTHGLDASSLLREFLRIVYWPRAHFWFLYNLFAMMLTSWILRRWTNRIAGTWLFVIFALALLLTYRLLDYFWLNDFAKNSIYFAAGMLSARLPKIMAEHASQAMLASVVTMITFALFSWVTIRAGLQHQLIVQPLLAFSGIAACIGFAFLWPGCIGSGLSRLGRSSLEIYVAHILIGFGALDAAHFIAGQLVYWPLWLAIGCLAGLLGPIWLCRLTTRHGMNWLFRLPVK